MFWRDIKLSRKLSLGFGLILVLLSIVCLWSISGIGGTLADVRELDNRYNLMAELMQKEVDHLEWAAAVSRALIEGTAVNLQVETDPHKCAFGKWYYSEARLKSELLAPSVKEPLLQMEEYHRKVHESAIAIKELLSRGDPQSRNKARAVFTAETIPNLNQFRELVGRVNDGVRQQAVSAEQRMLADASRTRIMLILVSLVAVLIGITMAAMIARSITRPLNIAVTAANQLAEGDASAGIEVERRDEMGQLLKAMENMARSTNEMAAAAARVANGDLTVKIVPRSERDTLGNALASMVTNLGRETREIMDGVNVLAASAGEISASTTQFASNATETAAAVSQTTTTMEEVRQTAQVSSQKASYISEIAQKAVQVSQTGRKSVEETIEDINQIREQVELIAESIVRLSEQSQAIGEIISTVDDLAEQSNLLAVNASIEAAKAGDQGKGFAVVAQEIKSLAEQSKQATAQVRTILHDIQKATGAAVMATEQGSKMVEAGVKQSAEAGESIRAMAKTIAETAQAVTQIAATAQQQFVGMDQASLAMENIQQASTQNVEGAKQLEYAARNLGELGQRLKQLVERYKV